MQKTNKEVTEQDALKKLAALCSRSEHCSYEMREKMTKWGLGEEAQARVMDKLVRGRYVDDERYARAFAGDKIRYNKWGRRKVEQALYMKHIDEDIRQRVLDEFSGEEFRESLRPLLVAKMKNTKAKSDYEMFCKLLRFALGRGFSYDEAHGCLEEILHDME